MLIPSPYNSDGPADTSLSRRVNANSPLVRDTPVVVSQAYQEG